MENKYTGPERRIAQRRIKVDRREMIRFEPDKEPRRSGIDRRKHDIWQDRQKF